MMPYRLMMDDKLVDYYVRFEQAVEAGRTINRNRRMKKAGQKKPQKIQVVYDTPHEIKIVHEE